MRSSATVPAGIGTAWLFCSHSTTFSSGRGAGRPANRSDGQALASWVQDKMRRCRDLGVSVHRVFHHVVPGDADGVDESWPVNGGRPKRSRTSRLSMEKPPGPAGSVCSHVARPRRRRRTGAATGASSAGAVVGPVVGGDQPRGQSVGVAEEDEIGREVQPSR